MINYCIMNNQKIICKYCNVEITNVYDNDVNQPNFGDFIHKSCALNYFNKIGYSRCVWCDFDYGDDRFVCRDDCLVINDKINVFLTTKNIKYKNHYWHNDCFVKKFFDFK